MDFDTYGNALRALVLVAAILALRVRQQLLLGSGWHASWWLRMGLLCRGTGPRGS